MATGYDGKRTSKRSMFATSVAILTLALVCGCSGDRSARFTRKVVKLDEVPKTIMDVAKKDMPSVNFDTAWQNLTNSGELDSYEVRGKHSESGKTREIRIAPDGKVLERE